MTRHHASFLAICVVAALALAACSAGSSVSSAPTASGVPGSVAAATTPGPAPSGPPGMAGTSGALSPSEAAAATAQPPTWRLVLMGDSVFLGIGSGAAPVIEDELGVGLEVREWINPDLADHPDSGERPAELLARLRTDEALRADIRSADAIWFDVPTGLLYDVCGPPDAPRAELEACHPKALNQYAADADAIMAEIVALRPPDQAVTRAMTVWQFYGPTFRAAGTYDLVRPFWQRLNAAAATAAVRHGIGLVGAYDAFSGPDGERDAVAAGDVLPDEVHLTGQGQGRLVELFVASGLTPSKP